MQDKRHPFACVRNSAPIDESAVDVIIRLCANGYAPAVSEVLVIAAHPDDEVVGAGGLFRKFTSAFFLHSTDGAPKNMADARAAGFGTRKAYALARRKELLSALAVASIKPEQCIEAGFIDQEASYRMGELAGKAAAAIRALSPEAVFTHPYEGGHPDHDATAFAVHAACRLLEKDGAKPPVIIEFASYHARDGKMAVSDFLPCDGCESAAMVLCGDERALKKRMMECFATQQRALAPFQVEMERYRPAPLYDFTAPPHPGKLFYEHYDWGITGARWRAQARRALQCLGLDGAI